MICSMDDMLCTYVCYYVLRLELELGFLLFFLEVFGFSVCWFGVFWEWEGEEGGMRRMRERES